MKINSSESSRINPKQDVEIKKTGQAEAFQTTATKTQQGPASSLGKRKLPTSFNNEATSDAKGLVGVEKTKQMGLTRITRERMNGAKSKTVKAGSSIGKFKTSAQKKINAQKHPTKTRETAKVHTSGQRGLSSNVMYSGIDKTKKAAASLKTQPTSSLAKIKNVQLGLIGREVNFAVGASKN